MLFVMYIYWWDWDRCLIKMGQKGKEWKENWGIGRLAFDIWFLRWMGGKL